MSGREPIGAVSGVDRTLPVLLTRAEVCQLLRVSRPTLNRWVAAGRIRRLEIGPRTVRYPAADVMALIDPSETSNAPAGNQGAAKGRSGDRDED